MKYITIDFETANSNPTSACSLGLVLINDDIKEEMHFLINPEEEFLDYNTTIHGITKADVEGADTFDRLWNKIKHLFVDTTVYAHNAGFDINVLRSMINKYNLEGPNIKWGCTLKIARKLWKDDLTNFKLGTISNYLEIDHNHHNALSDALVCVAIIERGIKVMRVDTDTELYEILGIRYGQYSDEKYYGSYNKYGRNKKIEVLENESLNNKVVFLSGKPSKLTRNELKERLTVNGVYVEKHINLSLDYFVKLGNSPKANNAKVKELNEKGKGISIVDEDMILSLIK